MSKMMKYGIGAVAVTAAIGGGAILYMNSVADQIAADLLSDAEQFVADNMNGATLSYSSYSSSGLSRSLTLADVSLAHENGSAITMDSITIAGSEEQISISDATNIKMQNRGETIAQIAALDIVNFAIPEGNMMLMLMDEDELAKNISVDQLSVRDASIAFDGESLTIGSLDIDNVRNASAAVSIKDMRFDGYAGAFGVDDFTVDHIDFIPLLMEDEDAIMRDMLGIGDMSVKGLVVDMADLNFNMASLTLDDITRDGGLMTSANMDMKGLKIDVEDIVGPDMAPMFMLIGINEIEVNGSTAYDISLAKGTVSGSFGLGVKGLGEIDMSAGFAGLTKDKYEDLLKNAAYIAPEDYIAYYGLGLDSLSVDYRDDSLADTLLDLYSGGNRANLAQEVSAMISFYGMMSQQSDLANAIAPAVSGFIKGGNKFSLSIKAKQSLNEDVIMKAMENGTLQDIITITASGS